ncbi:lef3 [Hemileuca sp. nucleopolyhedrovirus]|uniref:Lef3 n=1 Tax=Hemileuca sp. nucleopolyhedrovirus TaxID=1367203 RepID=S5MK32_9ABAC|nr:lef3 [Hemileuca sp. nucleopolyhedrovirus]AGR56816.1 lef3 [Hemileuca sp. nucleopolyhedrovirus]
MFENDQFNDDGDNLEKLLASPIKKKIARSEIFDDESKDGFNNTSKNKINKDKVKRELFKRKNTIDESILFDTKRIKLNTDEKSDTDDDRNVVDDDDGDNNDDFAFDQTKGQVFGQNKRMSSSSNASSSDTIDGGVRRAFKTLTGELIGKNQISINNETFYLLKFLFDNYSKEYYVDAGKYYEMKINNVYEVTLNYEKKKIYIGTYKQCKKGDIAVNVNKYLKETDFDGNDTVSVYVKFKYLFKVLGNHIYKLVYHVFIEDSVKEIECTVNFKKISNTITDYTVTTENDLFKYYFDNVDKIIKLQRIKCNQSSNGFKTFVIQPMTQIETKDDIDLNFDIDKKIFNVSRKNNKYIVTKMVSSINAELNHEERLYVTYQADDCTDVVRATHYANDNFNKGNLKSLEVEFNQLNDMIENNLIRVHIYVVFEAEKNICNILAVTKYDIEENTFSGL